METRKEEAQALLSQYHQEHLLQFYDELNDSSKGKLLDQIEQLDLEAVCKVWRRMPDSQVELLDGRQLSSIPACSWDEFTDEEQGKYAAAGWELLQQGKVGAIVVAGGHGSRLGHEGPKGTFNIGLPSDKSLFQLQAERLINLSERAGKPIAWYIMTSPDNHIQTVNFFEDHHYFGYGREHCTFFQQGMMPAIDERGKILLATKDEICLAPSGNGDCFAALKRTGALADIKRRGLEWLFYYNVDNALVKVADPLFIGVAACHPYPVAAKAVDKSYPEEPVGVLCYRNGRPAVVEYTVIPDEIMYEKDDRGRLMYHLGNISMQLFRFDFIEKVAGVDLPFAMAHKKIKCIDSFGKLMEPNIPNAYKMEQFIFDFFPLSEQITVLKVKREEEFAPVKNKEGEDSPASARELVLSLHHKWLLESGVSKERLSHRRIEISPLVSYAGEGLTPDKVRTLGI
ncbi:UTP--glucose-1-phosphate uridylyltransferase [Paenibacillus sp. UNC451MF]|uniref:UTP--glucose-1-phosphate uridylyltransferase n=1 Tax=Paenibacillus sp. UNC451MF TaxID=1449063 RepID=UPI0006920237|nr:UDPGP type 1 family protein [Paenibacillus sp. UNC451MF]